MENKKRKILIVEDDKIDRMAFERFANEEKLPYNYIFAESVKEAKKFLEKEIFDAVLLDYRLGDGTAFDLFDKVETFPFIIVTGTGDEEIAVKAMKSGAYDYLIKDAEGNYLKILPVTVENAIKHKLAEEASKRTEEEILLKHKQLLSIFDSIDEVIYVADPTTYELLYFNEAFKSRWKVNVGDKCYKVLQNQTSPCSFCSNKYIFGENLGKTYIWEWQNLVDRHWYRCIDRAIKWPDGRMVRYEMAIDVTERKQTEEALRESEERYRKLVETTPTVIYTLSAKDGAITSLNPAFEKITGWLCSEWLGKTFMSLIHPDDLPVAIESFQQVIQGEPQPLYELRILSKSGEYLVGEFLSIPHIEKGKVVGEFGIARDITERKRAEETLRVSEERYRTLVERMNEGLLLVDNNDVIQFANDRFAQMVGYSREELLGKVGYKLLLLEEDHEFLLEKNRLRTQGISDQYEIQYKRKSGEIIWVIISGSPVVDAQENVIGSVGIHTDITERKLAEQASKQAEEELQKRLRELELYYNITIGRESRIIELKHQVNELLERLGEKKKYKT